MIRPASRHLLLGSVLLIWLAVVIGGWLVLTAYGQRSGVSAIPPERIETQQSNRFRLLMFVHPRCACSLASMRELERTLARCDGKVAAEIYFFLPTGAGEDWAHSALWNMAAAIPDVRVQVDAGGEAAGKYCVRTSGTVLLYDPQGQLCFQGGLTAARGHEGDSAGKAAILSIAQGLSAAEPSTRVFGCSLSNNRP